MKIAPDLVPLFVGIYNRFTFKGREYKKEGFETKEIAEKEETEQRHKLLHPEKNPQPGQTFSELANEYLDLHCKDRHQQNTYRQKAYVFRSFIAYLGHYPVAESVVSETLLRFMKARKDANYLYNISKRKPEQEKFLEKFAFLVNRREADGRVCANRDLKELNALYNWAKKHSKVANNPCANVEKYGEAEKSRYVPPVEDLDRVLLCAENFELDFLQVLYHTAGRLTEALKLTWNDVNFQHRWVQLWTRKRKNGELGVDKVEMSETLYKCLYRRWEERDKTSNRVFSNPNSDSGYYTKDIKIIRDMMDRLCKKAGVKRFTFYAIRHHVAMLIADSNKATLRQIQGLLRHRRITTTAWYLNSLRPDMGSIVDVLDESAEKIIARQTLTIAKANNRK